MPNEHYVALLRGINVGGRNKVPMADLREAVAAAGFDDVDTYIQTGNVFFTTDRTRDAIVPALEAALLGRFGFEIPIALRSRPQIRKVVDEAPTEHFGDPDRYHSDVVFLRDGATPVQVLEAVTPREGVDHAWPGTGVVYFSRLSERRGQSRLSNLSKADVYARITVRNWNTTLEARRRLDAR